MSKRIGRVPRTDEDIEQDVKHQLKTKYLVDENGCWIWQGGKTGNGYGKLSRYLTRSKFRRQAHGASFQVHIGEIPEGLLVCHTCDVKTCINPDHLWLGTNQQNQIDARDKGILARYWTPEKRVEQSKKYSGVKNPMYGVSGEKAPCYGRCGDKHPMFGKHHTEEVKQQISKSLKQRYSK